MFEGVKYGLHAEMIRDRGFEEAPDSTGLSRHWQRYPDDRNDDYAMSLRHDADVAYPRCKQSDGTTGGHSLRCRVEARGHRPPWRLPGRECRFDRARLSRLRLGQDDRLSLAP